MSLGGGTLSPFVGHIDLITLQRRFNSSLLVSADVVAAAAFLSHRSNSFGGSASLVSSLCTPSLSSSSSLAGSKYSPIPPFLFCFVIQLTIL